MLLWLALWTSINDKPALILQRQNYKRGHRSIKLMLKFYVFWKKGINWLVFAYSINTLVIVCIVSYTCWGNQFYHNDILNSWITFKLLCNLSWLFFLISFLNNILQEYNYMKLCIGYVLLYASFPYIKKFSIGS